jgi:hypothetical protein
MKGDEMGYHLPFHDLILLGLVYLGMTCYWLWRRHQATPAPVHRQPVKYSTRRSQDPKSFPGLTTKPPCASCERATKPHPAPPSLAPPLLTISTRGRQRQVDTQYQFCPKPTCRYYGWAISVRMVTLMVVPGASCTVATVRGIF